MNLADGGGKDRLHVRLAEPVAELVEVAHRIGV
jgi:hypothetical protein